MRRYLLDASAVLAFMSNETGAEKVRAVLLEGQAGVTAINISEVAAKLIARGLSSVEAEFQCRSMGLDILETDEGIAFAAAALVPFTQPLGLSLGDRVCLATAARDAIELALADESIALQSAQLKWLESMTENARQRAANPDATGIDALRLESELARETQILAAARRTRESLTSSLNLRLGRPLESPWPTLDLGNASYSVPLANSEIARISHANPKVRSLREMASAASAETRIADRERLPQLSVGVDVDTYSGSDFRSASLGLKMSLPYVNRSSYSAKIAASQLREKAALQDIETTRLEVASGVLAAVAESKNAAAQARAYSGEVYQRALSASQAVEGSWISSKSSVADLLDAQRQLFSIRLEQRRFVAMQRVALEELNQLVPKLN
ncbi:MAG: TolC family protein [Pseudomonadota bacterium]